MGAPAPSLRPRCNAREGKGQRNYERLSVLAKESFHWNAIPDGPRDGLQKDSFTHGIASAQ